MKYHQTLNERKMVVFVVQTSRYFGPSRILPYPAVSCVSCRILPYPAVSCRILPYPAVSCRILPYPAVSCRILPYPAVSCRILPYRIRVTGKPNWVIAVFVESGCCSGLKEDSIFYIFEFGTLDFDKCNR